MSIVQFRVGLYCSNSSAREAQYGFTVVDRPEGYLILAVVASGDEILELTEPHEVMHLIYLKLQIITEKNNHVWPTSKRT
jgi:hypothetical protein